MQTESEMSRRDLLTDERRLFEELCKSEWLGAGFRNVKKNKGSPGVDGVTIAEFEARLDEELDRLKAELESWTYKPSPVRRVEIPKPGGKGIRLLGVPTVRDRVVHATLKLLLEPIFEPLFSEHSYGFRPERSQAQAVEAARKIVAGGKPYVVDIDLAKFFDRIHHDRLIARLGQTIPDKRILRLVGMILRSGIMANGLVTPSTEGAVQGSPLSPLLSNIVLDELDKELERRGLEFCRFADDCVPRRHAGGRSPPCSHAAQEMRAGPSKPPYRRRLQTTHCCCLQERWWCASWEKAGRDPVRYGPWSRTQVNR
jgi:group II intron reverse transcriptase/maturase